MSRARPMSFSLCSRMLIRSSSDTELVKNWAPVLLAQNHSSRLRRAGRRRLPLMITSPSLCRKSPLSTSPSVVLPTPLGPMIAVTRCVKNERSRPRHTCVLPRRQASPLHWMAKRAPCGAGRWGCGTRIAERRPMRRRSTSGSARISEGENCRHMRPARRYR